MIRQLIQILMIAASMQLLSFSVVAQDTTNNKESANTKDSIAEALRTSTNISSVEALNQKYNTLISQPQAYQHSEKEFNQLGYYFLGKKKPRLAIEAFTLNVKKFPESSNVYDSLAEAYYSENNLDLAEQNYLFALNLDPNYQSAWKSLAKIYKKTKSDGKAEALFNKALSNSQFQHWGLEQLGDLYLKRDNQNKASTYYLEAWRIKNKPDGAFDKLVKLAKKSGRKNKHLEIANLYRMARIQTPYLYGMWQGEVRALIKSKNMERVEQTLKEAKTALPYKLAKKLGATPKKTNKQSKKGITFTAMGCGPYSHASEKKLKSHIKSKKKTKHSQFIIHLGDIFNGNNTHSKLGDFKNVADLFINHSKNPAFFVLGDNEWNDQANPNQALNFWQQTIAPINNIDHPRFKVKKQTARPENFTFHKGNVQFIGINQVGGFVHDKKEWKQRIHDNGEWIKENLNQSNDSVIAAVIFAQASADVFEQALISDLQKAARKFGKPILYLHADGHNWIVEKGKWASNITRVQTDMLFPSKKKSPISHPPVTIYVTPSTQLPFVFDRHI